MIRDELGATEIPKLPIKIQQPGVQVRAQTGTIVLADHVQPYFNPHWDGFHGHYYVPPDRASGLATMTQYGSVIHIASSIFRNYATLKNPDHRSLVAAAIRLLAPDPLVLALSLPTFARITLTSQKNRTMIHLLSYLPELRDTKHQIIEEPVVLSNINLSIRHDLPKRIYLAPQEEDVDCQANNSRIDITVPQVADYQMVVIET